MSSSLTATTATTATTAPIAPIAPIAPTAPTAPTAPIALTATTKNRVYPTSISRHIFQRFQEVVRSTVTFDSLNDVFVDFLYAW